MYIFSNSKKTLYIHALLQEHWGAVRIMIYPAPTSCTPNDSITVINSYLSLQLASWVSLHIASWERLCDSSWRLMWTVLGHLKWKALWKRQIVNWEKDITNLHHLRNTKVLVDPSTLCRRKLPVSPLRHCQGFLGSHHHHHRRQLQLQQREARDPRPTTGMGGSE